MLLSLTFSLLPVVEELCSRLNLNRQPIVPIIRLNKRAIGELNWRKWLTTFS